MTSPVESGESQNVEKLVPQTLAKLHLAAMRHHQRAAALLSRRDGKWLETPDWRFDRQVIRLALFLQDRASLLAGERIAVLSPMRPEWPVLDFAAALQGVSAVAIDPALPDPALAGALARAAAPVVFVAGQAMLDRLNAVNRGSPGPRLVVAFDAPVAVEGALLWAEALDLAGTLDTPERAQSLRAHAREVSPDANALGQAVRGADGSISIEFLRHSEVMTRIRAAWARRQAREGDVAYLSGGAATFAARLALFSFVGDGRTTTALGTADRELEDIAEVRPHKIVAPGAVLEAALRAAPPAPRTGSAIRTWLGARLGRKGVDVPSPLGGRARWVQPTGDLPAGGLRSLQDFVTVEREA